MTEVTTPVDVEIAIVVVRCGCGNPGGHPNAVCPTPRVEQDLGVVAFTSKNPLKRLLWALHGKPAADRRIQESNRS